MGTPGPFEHGKKLVDTEGLRKSYRPERIIVLLVGEAPPPNGTFFYRCDSNLFGYTKEAFATAFNLQFNSDTDFLTFFRGRGFFLDDLRLQPIDRADRSRQRQAAVGSLAIRIQGYDPKYVFAVMKGIEPHVRQAASRAGVTGERIHVLPFPTHGNQGRYVQGLVAVLRSIMPDTGTSR